MKGGMVKGLMTGMLLGSAAATVFGVMNWKTVRSWNQSAKKTGSWISSKADDITGKL